MIFASPPLSNYQRTSLLAPFNLSFDLPTKLSLFASQPLRIAFMPLASCQRTSRMMTFASHPLYTTGLLAGFHTKLSAKAAESHLFCQRTSRIASGSHVVGARCIFSEVGRQFSGFTSDG